MTRESEIKHQLFGISIDALRMPQAVQRLRGWLKQDSAECRYVVTPNVDHAVLLNENEAFKDAYRDADLILASCFFFHL